MPYIQETERHDKSALGMYIVHKRQLLANEDGELCFICRKKNSYVYNFLIFRPFLNEF